MTNWLDYFMGKRRKGPDINKPVPIGDPMQDLRAPIPQEPKKNPKWDIYNRNERYRRWMTRERQA